MFLEIPARPSISLDVHYNLTINSVQWKKNPLKLKLVRTRPATPPFPSAEVIYVSLLGLSIFTSLGPSSASFLMFAVGTSVLAVSSPAGGESEGHWWLDLRAQATFQAKIHLGRPSAFYQNLRSTTRSKDESRTGSSRKTGSWSRSKVPEYQLDQDNEWSWDESEEDWPNQKLAKRGFSSSFHAH